MIDYADLDRLVNSPAYYCTNLQYKFYKRALDEYGIELDMKTCKTT